MHHSLIFHAPLLLLPIWVLHFHLAHLLQSPNLLRLLLFGAGYPGLLSMPLLAFLQRLE